jgi:hypothetical protein
MYIVCQFLLSSPTFADAPTSLLGWWRPVRQKIQFKRHCATLVQAHDACQAPRPIHFEPASLCIGRPSRRRRENEKNRQIASNPFLSGRSGHKYTPLVNMLSRPCPTTMDRMEVFVPPIRRVLEPLPVYVITSLLLGFSVFRWNANRVRGSACAITPPC